MAEKEYIERGSLLEQLSKKKSTITTQRYVEGFNDAVMRFRSMVHSAPAADVAEVRHGEWLPTSIPSYFGGFLYKCSECSATDREHSTVLGTYCWRCGAKMDGGTDNGEKL